MNKNIITRMLIAVVIALVGYGCDPNYFNEHYLPDYDNSGEITDVKEIGGDGIDDEYQEGIRVKILGITIFDNVK